MLHYNRIDLSKGIDPAKSNNGKELLSVTIGFLIMDLNFKLLLVMVTMI